MGTLRQAHGAHRLEFRILGPLAVRIDGAAVPVGGPKQRALLALLLLSANRVVSRDRLVGELFADQSVNSADHALRNQVSRLRKVLMPRRGRRAAPGRPRARLPAPRRARRARPRSLRAARRGGREALAAGDARDGGRGAARGGGAVEGRPLADLEFEPFARVDVERLEELRLAALEDRLDADLALGRQLALVAELEALAAEHPVRERFRAQLMLALYRCGRQAEGLEVYRRTRALLNEELGLEPGVRAPAARAGDPRPGPGARAGRQRRRRRRLRRDPTSARSRGWRRSRPTDAEFFFGRERLVDELVARLGESSLLAIVGPSGSGKSSLLRAGLLPALEGEACSSGRASAGGELVAAAVERRRRASRVVVAVDQFEELFAAAVAEDERRAFVDVLVDAAWDPERRALVLLALRADFFGRLAPYVALADLVGPNHVLLGPMSRASSGGRSRGRPSATGLEVEPALVDALVDDVGGEAGGLPLLSTALSTSGATATDEPLTLAAYERTGGVRGAVGRHAEAAFRSLDDDEQEVARRILLRLVAGGDGEPLTRRRATRAELDADDDERGARPRGARRPAAARRRAATRSSSFTRRSSSAGRGSPSGWRRTPRAAACTGTWREAAVRLGGLGPRCGRAVPRRPPRRGARVGRRGRRRRRPQPLEREFLEESRTALRARTGGCGRCSPALVLLLAGAGSRAPSPWPRAGLRAARRRPQSPSGSVPRRWSSRARPPRCCSHARAQSRRLARRRGATCSPTLLRSPAAIRSPRQGSDRLLDEALSPDGRLLAVRGDDGGVVIFDAADTAARRQARSRQQPDRASWAHQGPLHDLAFSPDGQTLAVGGSDGHIGTLDLVSVATGGARSFAPSGSLFTADVAFTPDGRTVATGEPASGFESPRPERSSSAGRARERA